MTRVGILADDLTGALDTGIQFQRLGLWTEVVLPFSRGHLPGAEVVVVDMETRPLAAADAAAEAGEWATRLSDRVEVIYHKIDSTLRGNWPDELTAIRGAAGVSPVVVCPALPAQRRTVREGIVWVGAARQAGRIMDHLPADTNVVVPDAETDEDLDRIAAAYDCARLLVGSAGLAAALARRLAGERSCRAPELAAPGCRRVAVLCGSMIPVAREQARLLGRRPEVRRLSLAEGLRVGPEAVVLLPAPPAAPESVERREVSASLAERARTIQEIWQPDGWVVTGGETAIQLLRELRASGVELVTDLAPGIPVGRIRGGPAGGSWLITKAGGFGGPSALIDATEWLRSVPG